MIGRPPIDGHKLEPKVLAVMKLHDEQGLSNRDTGKVLGISESTVKRIRQRPIYHEIATDIIEKQCRSLEEYFKKLDDLSFNATQDKFDGYIHFA